VACELFRASWRCHDYDDRFGEKHFSGTTLAPCRDEPKDLPESRHSFIRRAIVAAITFDTPETLMLFALDGRLSKGALASLLSPSSRPAFLQACAAVERRLTERCAEAGDPCLESGCSCEGDVCLQPVLRAGTECFRACGAEWVRFFADADNRELRWRQIILDYQLQGRPELS
jgi:hypothetical protein